MHGTVSQILPAPCEDVFDLVHDYDRRLAWDTLLRAASLTDGWRRAEQGATAICTGRWSLGGFAMKTAYVTFQRPRLAAVKMINRPACFNSWSASIRHDDIGPGQSRITYTWHFTARPRRLAWLLEPLMQRIFRWETERRLTALRRFFLTLNH